MDYSKKTLAVPIKRRSFIKRQTSGTSSDNEWQRVVQWVTTSGTVSDNEWKRVTTSGTTRDNEWQRVTIPLKKSYWIKSIIVIMQNICNLIG